MRLIIFGSSGGTGRELVRVALDRGHAVTAFVRDPAALADRDRLEVVVGDALDSADVERAVDGHEAVLCALGKPATSPGRLRSEGTGHIVRAMQRSGPRRLICLSTIGIGDTRPLMSPLYRYVLIPSLLRRTFADHARQEALVRSSGLDWTIVRAGVLTDGPQTERHAHGFPPSDRSRQIEISRADVASFMLGQIDESTYVGEAPSVSY